MTSTSPSLVFQLSTRLLDLVTQRCALCRQLILVNLQASLARNGMLISILANWLNAVILLTAGNLVDVLRMYINKFND